MKRGIWSVGLAILWATAAPAQTKNKTAKKDKAPAANVQVVPQAQQPEARTGATTWGHYQAKTFRNEGYNNLTISDPTVRTLNMRAHGVQVPWDSKDILGVPKIVYGVGNGQILFRSRGATTSGTGTGSGAVGTGSSTGPVGTHGYIMGVNGKSPYAGPIMDGIIVTDINETRHYLPPRKPRNLLRPRQ